ncbi:MAG: transmembrane anchor protein, partial [Rubrivivax sp.]
MYNTDIPTRAELPTTAQLIRSTVIAAVSALVLLVTVVLPSEYAIDPSGLGRVLGLTEMGQIKSRLAAEAVADAAAVQRDAATAPAVASVSAPAAAPVTSPPAAPSADPAPVAPAATPWRDERRFTLTPGQGIEIKLRMKEGDKALYAWTVEGGVVNYDTHGDALGRSISYVKGRGVAADEGELVAAFTG